MTSTTEKTRIKIEQQREDHMKKRHMSRVYKRMKKILQHQLKRNLEKAHSTPKPDSNESFSSYEELSDPLPKDQKKHTRYLKFRLKEELA